jgi:hypothetical protein
MGERIVWILVCVLLAGALVYVVNRQQGDGLGEAGRYGEELAALEARIDSMKAVIEGMQALVGAGDVVRPGDGAEPRDGVAGDTGDDGAEDVASGRGALMEHEIRRFRSYGLENPEEDILRDLFENPQLIPHEGILGGTMRFHSMDDLKLINGQWAFARYEDGHITGEMLLEYQVNRNGTISWTVIRASSL